MLLSPVDRKEFVLDTDAMARQRQPVRRMGEVFRPDVVERAFMMEAAETGCLCFGACTCPKPQPHHHVVPPPPRPHHLSPLGPNPATWGSNAVFLNANIEHGVLFTVDGTSSFVVQVGQSVNAPAPSQSVSVKRISDCVSLTLPAVTNKQEETKVDDLEFVGLRTYEAGLLYAVKENAVYPTTAVLENINVATHVIFTADGREYVLAHGQSKTIPGPTGEVTVRGPYCTTLSLPAVTNSGEMTSDNGIVFQGTVSAAAAGQRQSRYAISIVDPYGATTELLNRNVGSIVVFNVNGVQHVLRDGESIILNEVAEGTVTASRVAECNTLSLHAFSGKEESTSSGDFGLTAYLAWTPQRHVVYAAEKVIVPPVVQTAVFRNYAHKYVTFVANGKSYSVAPGNDSGTVPAPSGTVQAKVEGGPTIYIAAYSGNPEAKEVNKYTLFVAMKNGIIEYSVKDSVTPPPNPSLTEAVFRNLSTRYVKFTADGKTVDVAPRNVSATMTPAPTGFIKAQVKDGPTIYIMAYNGRTEAKEVEKFTLTARAVGRYVEYIVSESVGPVPPPPAPAPGPAPGPGRAMDDVVVTEVKFHNRSGMDLEHVGLHGIGGEFATGQHIKKNKNVSLRKSADVLRSPLLNADVSNVAGTHRFTGALNLHSPLVSSGKAFPIAVAGSLHMGMNLEGLLEYDKKASKSNGYACHKLHVTALKM